MVQTLLFEKLQKLDKKHVTHLFGISVDKAARVAAYATSTYPDWVGDIGSRMDELAKDDLVAFAVTARRLFESVGFIHRARNLTVSTLEPIARRRELAFVRRGSTSIWRVLNGVIHAQSLEFFRSESQVRLFAGVSLSHEEMYERIVAGGQDFISPVVLVGSDNGRTKLYDMAELIEIFETILSEIADRCADENIYLGAFWSFD